MRPRVLSNPFLGQVLAQWLMKGTFLGRWLQGVCVLEEER